MLVGVFFFGLGQFGPQLVAFTRDLLKLLQKRSLTGLTFLRGSALLLLLLGVHALVLRKVRLTQNPSGQGLLLQVAEGLLLLKLLL